MLSTTHFEEIGYSMSLLSESLSRSLCLFRGLLLITSLEDSVSESSTFCSLAWSILTFEDFLLAAKLFLGLVFFLRFLVLSFLCILRRSLDFFTWALVGSSGHFFSRMHSFEVQFSTERPEGCSIVALFTENGIWNPADCLFPASLWSKSSFTYNRFRWSVLL